MAEIKTHGEGSVDTLLEMDLERSSDEPKVKQGISRRQLLIRVSVVAIMVVVSGVGLGLAWSGKFTSSTSSAKSSIGGTTSISARPLTPVHNNPAISHTSHPSTMQSTNPTSIPSGSPSFLASASPSQEPSVVISNSPSINPTELPTVTEQVTTFYAIGDVPYTPEQAVELKTQMLELPRDAEFLIHVGDLRSADENNACILEEYQSAAAILRLSHTPVFVLLGDNDWNDCPNQNAGLAYWKSEFLNFESRYWNHTFKIVHHPVRPENFAFEHKGTLFVGLNLVGGAVQSKVEWSSRLTDEVDWTMDLIRTYAKRSSPRVGRVVLFGQADPTYDHHEFFDPLQSFVKFELQNEIPIMYINGDRHYWLYQPRFYGQPSFLRIMLTGKTVDPPLKVMVHATGSPAETQDAFVYDRML